MLIKKDKVMMMMMIGEDPTVVKLIENCDESSCQSAAIASNLRNQAPKFFSTCFFSAEH